MPWKASGDGLPAMTGEIPQEAIEAGSRDILIGNGWALDLTAYPSGPVREGAAEEVVRAVLTAVLPLIEQRVIDRLARQADGRAQRLQDAIHAADRELITIADFSIQEAADAIDSVRASLKDALAETDVPAPDDARSVPDPVLCAACGGTGHRNGNRRAADPFGTCPGCNGTGVRPAPANPYTLTAQTTAAHAWNEGFAAGRSAERARLAEIDVMAFGKATCARFTYAEEQPYEAVGDRDSLRLRAFLDAYLRAALSEGSPE